jgi:hypothetical protein
MTKPISITDMQAALLQQQAIIEQLQAEREQLQAKLASRAPAVTVKLSEQTPGVISVYGLGRYPVSLYGGQWRKLIDQGVPQIEALLKANPSLLEKQSKA